MKTIEYRYTYTRYGITRRTRWGSRDDAQQRMARRIGPFHDCGMVAGDGDSNRDGSHNGCARAGGLLTRESRSL